MTVKATIQDTQFKAKLGDLKKFKSIVMPQLYAEFVKNTPVATGNAKVNTSMKDTTITANYPYAFVLDAGRGFRDGQMRGSVQAPDGMTEPTIELAKKLIPKVLKDLGSKR
jgi:hypothetical protein